MSSLLATLQLLISLIAFFGFLFCVALLFKIWDKEFLEQYREEQLVKRKRWENIKKAFNIK